MQIVARGAEAVLYRELRDGKAVLVKERIKKSYRIAQIDEKLRLERTRAEARLMNEARRAGVAVPAVLAVDEKNAKIVMEFIDGARLKELLNETDDKTRISLAKLIGDAVAKLHSHNLIHGDLTTSNMIFCSGSIFFIDFGLGFFSSHPEDQGVDLAVLHEAIRSTHFQHLDAIWGGILSSYSTAFSAAAKSLKALEGIENRGRYVRRKVQPVNMG
jgi:TP53 regulating kinase-like protein